MSEYPEDFEKALTEPSQALTVIPDNPEWDLRETSVVTHKDREFVTLAADPYVGVAALPFDDKAQTTLAEFEHVPDEWIDIRPEGLIYLSHMKARHVLNKAFGFGGWAIVPSGDFVKEEKGNHVILYRQYRLYVNGRFAGETMAAGDYWTNNSSQNYADAAEACQSYALNRLAKNFGIASQCWDKAYGEQWKRKYAETYIKDGKTCWRKKSNLDGAGAAHSTAKTDTLTQDEMTESHAAQSSTASPAPSGGVVIKPKDFGKIWEKGGFVNDADGGRWTFPKKLLATAEMAMVDGKSLKITYKQNKNFKNVESAEIV